MEAVSVFIKNGLWSTDSTKARCDFRFLDRAGHGTTMMFVTPALPPGLLAERTTG